MVARTPLNVTLAYIACLVDTVHQRSFVFQSSKNGDCPSLGVYSLYPQQWYTWFVQKVSGLTTVHEVDKAYEVLSLIVFNIVPLRSYTFRPTFLPLLETSCKLLFQDV